MLRVLARHFPGWAGARSSSSTTHHEGKYEMGKKTLIGVAFTKAGREKAALRDTVNRTGVDPDDLTYTEDARSQTAKVTTSDGKVVGRYSS